MSNTTPIEKCSLGKNATYDAKIAMSKGWTNLAIYPNGNLIGTSPCGIDDEFVPRYAEMLAECAPELLAALEKAKKQLEWYENAITGEDYNDPDLNALIARAKGEK